MKPLVSQSRRSAGFTFQKVLVIQLRALGDVVLTTAAVSILKKNFPHARIHFLTSPGIDSLLKDLPEIDRMLTLPVASKNPATLAKMLLKIRQNKYDLVIDFQGTPGTAFLTKFSGAPSRLGWKMKRRQWAYNIYSAANRKREYVALQKCRVLSEIGIHEVTTQIRISIGESDILTVEKYLDSLKIDRNRLLVNITPKGKRQARTWFPEKTARVADLLIQKYGAVIFYNYGPGEKDYLLRVKALNKGAVNILPEWPLRIFAAFMSQIDLHFSYDNGPKHLAVALGTPTLSLFATDPPELWNPPDTPNHAFILADVPCKFCGLRNCDLMICMKKIEPEDVLKKIEKIPGIREKLKRANSSRAE